MLGSFGAHVATAKLVFNYSLALFECVGAEGDRWN